MTTWINTDLRTSGSHLGLLALLGSVLAGCSIAPAGSRGEYRRESGEYSESSSESSSAVAAPNTDLDKAWDGFQQTGIISYYAAKFEGRKTASGEIYSGSAFTAAHRELPFGTQIKVTNLKTGQSVLVRVNDRGPFAKGRVLDVSRIAAEQLGMLGLGTLNARVEVAAE